MNPVHSSLAPFFEALGHFHAILKPPATFFYFSRVYRQVNATSQASCRMIRLNQGTGVGRRLVWTTSSNDRKSPSAVHHRNIQIPAAPDAFSFFCEGRP